MKNLYLIFLFFVIKVSAQEKFQVFFDFNKDIPTEKSSIVLQEWIAKNPDVVITKLMGFCDSIDTNNYNKDLAHRRMYKVLETLAGNSISIDIDMDMVALGENFELSTDAAKNRRVDIYYEKKAAKLAGEPNNSAAKPDEIQLTDTDIETKFANVKKGDIVVIKNINFYFNSEKVMPESEPVLEELYQTMSSHPKLIIEIHGHICCNPNVNDTKLSFRRAKFIFSFLLKKGIPLNRLNYKGFGSARPIYKIPEKTLLEMAANRRVEILVIDI